MSSDISNLEKSDTITHFFKCQLKFQIIFVKFVLSLKPEKLIKCLKNVTFGNKISFCQFHHKMETNVFNVLKVITSV